MKNHNIPTVTLAACDENTSFHHKMSLSKEPENSENNKVEAERELQQQRETTCDRYSSSSGAAHSFSAEEEPWRSDNTPPKHSNPTSLIQSW